MNEERQKDCFRMSIVVRTPSMIAVVERHAGTPIPFADQPERVLIKMIMNGHLHPDMRFIYRDMYGGWSEVLWHHPDGPEAVSIEGFKPVTGRVLEALHTLVDMNEMLDKIGGNSGE